MASTTPQQLPLDLTGAGAASAKGLPPLPRLTVMPNEAARMLGVSRDFFDEHVRPELRTIRRGRKTILIPIRELDRWAEQSAARWDER
jgi:hypothetical protein